MTKSTFAKILEYVKDRFTYKDTNYRDAISPSERLAIFLYRMGSNCTHY